MANKVVELRQKRAQLVTDARLLLDKAQAEGRDLTQEEQNSWDAAMADEARLARQIEREERMGLLEGEIAAQAGALRPDETGGQEGRGQVAFKSRTLRGLALGDPQWQQQPEWRRLAAVSTPEYRRAFAGHLLRGEQRGLQADVDAAGGFLVTPLQLVDQLLAAIDDQVWMRQVATVIAVPNADSLGIPTLDNDPADADWTAELATGNEDTTMSLGRRELHPHPVAKRLRISRTLLRRVPNSEALAMGRLGYKFGITQEKGFLVGNGVNQPLGVFTPSANGISTDRDVATGNSATAITFDGLINAKYALKAAYWPLARWLFHRDAVKQIALIRDGSGGAGTGQYVWYPSVREGEPDMLLGRPLMVSEYAPNTFTTAKYVGVFGDFSNYWIADSLQLDMQRLVELYAATNQIALIGRMESDGMPVLAEAFVRIKLG